MTRCSARLTEAGDRDADPLPGSASPFEPRTRTRVFRARSLPLAESIAGEVLSLPIGPHLSLEEARKVAAALSDFAGTPDSRHQVSPESRRSQA